MVIGPRSSPLRAKVAWTCLQLGCLPEPGESSTGVLAATIGRPCPNCPTSPSSPRRFEPPWSGRPSPPAAAPAPLAVRGTPAELEALVGQRLRRHPATWQVPAHRPRAGSRSSFNPMLTGRFQLAAPGDKLPTKTAVVLGLRSARRPAAEAGSLDARRRLDAGRRRRGRGPLPRPDADGQGLPAAGGRRATVPGLTTGSSGPDADDPALTLDVWRQRIRKHPGELKNLLKNQAFVAGIGNAYSDEILHAARLLPFRKRSSLAPEEVDALYEATRLDAGGGDHDAPASASRRRSRSRSATSWRSTTRAARPARAAGRRSARSSRAGSSRRSAGAASAEPARLRGSSGAARCCRSEPVRPLSCWIAATVVPNSRRSRRACRRPDAIGRAERRSLGRGAAGDAGDLGGAAPDAAGAASAGVGRAWPRRRRRARSATATGGAGAPPPASRATSEDDRERERP